MLLSCGYMPVWIDPCGLVASLDSWPTGHRESALGEPFIYEVR
jgi:hypothetical protein